MRNIGSWIMGGAACLGLALGGCVTTGTHEKVLQDLDQTRKELAGTRDELAKEKDERSKEKAELDGKLAAAISQGQAVEASLASMTMKVEQLTGEKTKLASERAKLTDEQKEMIKQIEELKRIRAAAEKRMADYRSLLDKLRKMMDAGTLQVKVRNGLMLVQMSSDVVFASASTQIKAEAKEALIELAQTLGTFENRRFLVIGHSDSTPIRSARFPSNWELSSQRAVEVVKLLTENGVRPENISAAGAAEFDPLMPNDNAENRTVNRRVEIIFLPKIDEMPGFEEVLKQAG